ncbi:uncharacterized protein LOC128279139 [Anopheles cruzii]|uniref:uncharacterized protein LOC128279139 n=1 Tax=Anopheles cruzii TaxID=68878 RepID=UPI0022EC73BF|nr:uncharacterized protein LOC128279139 [Anopheles cruzii]
MYAAVVLAALCWVVQVAHSRPDFGLEGSVPGTNRITRQAILAQQHFLTVDDYILPDLRSDVTKLKEAAVILRAIGHQVNNLGPVLMDAISTAVNDDSGDIGQVFELVSYARLAFVSYINGALSQQETSLTALLQQYVSDQLQDDFFHIMAQLIVMGNTFDQLQVAVQAAYNAAGGGPVSAQLVQQYISVNLVTTLSQTLSALAYRIPVLTYTITSSLEDIQQADDYVYGLAADSERVAQEIAESGADFYQQVSSYATDVSSAMNALVASFTPSLTNALATATAYPDPSLQVPIGQLATLVQTTLAATVASFNSAYDAKIQYLSTLLPINTTDVTPPESDPLTVLVDVLIANWRYSRYCFWKYSGVLYNTLLVSNGAGECYDREVERLAKLKQALLLEIDLLAFNLEIVEPFVATCLFLPASAASRVPGCIQELAQYFANIYNAFTPRLASFTALAAIELDASEQRLSVCWATRTQEVQFTLQQLVPPINSCAIDGPNASY